MFKLPAARPPNCLHKAARSRAFICLDHKLWKICFFESCFHGKQTLFTEVISHMHAKIMEWTSVSRLTHWAVGANAVAALLPCQVILIAHGAHAVGSRVAIEAAACGTKHGHRALVGLLGHC